ncbi:peptidase associated/transthyretin-like domain-containing protein [Polaribacter sp. M15]
MLKKILFLFSILFTLISSAQNQKRFIKGIVLDSLGIVKNVNIINQNTKLGTFSNDQGVFGIYASKDDTLKFSSVQHINKIIVVTDRIFFKQNIKAILKLNTYTLDEITLKKHNLTGILTSDIKQIPKEKRDSILKDNLDFSNIDINQKDSRIDKNNRAEAPVVTVDPTQKNQGINLLGFLSLKKKKFTPIVKNEFDKTKVPHKIRAQLGEDYFLNKLKIPKQNYHQFLEFCNLSKVINLFKKEDLLELIQLFENQSIPYLETIKKK